jgi:hypothetical protein
MNGGTIGTTKLTPNAKSVLSLPVLERSAQLDLPLAIHDVASCNG